MDNRWVSCPAAWLRAHVRTNHSGAHNGAPSQANLTSRCTWLTLLPG